MTATRRLSAIQNLKRSSRRDPLLIAAITTLLLGIVLSWATLDVEWTHPISGESVWSVRAGAFDDFIPKPLRDLDPDANRWPVFWDWVRQQAARVGWRGATAGLAMSVLAILLSGVIGWVLFLPATAPVMLRGGWLEADREGRPIRRTLLFLAWVLTRAWLIVLRAIPEFVWAFLFLLALGPTLLAGVLALAMHNGGILGKLASESLEDTDPRPLRSLAGLGAPSSAMILFGMSPRILPQFLVYFFYRWETCLREAAILGILGFATLGLFIDHAFASLYLDRALCFVAFNSALVIGGDFLGAWIRRRLRA